MVSIFRLYSGYIHACLVLITNLCLLQKLIDISIKQSNIILKDPNQFLVKTNGLTTPKSNIGQLLSFNLL